MEFFEKLADGSFGFNELGESISGIFGDFFAEGGTIKTIWDFVAGFVPYAWIFTLVLTALSVVQILFGKKLLGFQKFVACLAIGFACGTVYVYPLLEGIGWAIIPDWAVGLVVGVVAALLSKLIYFLAYILAAGAGVYFLCMGDILPEAIASITGQWYIALIAAVVAIVVALLLRKIIETVGIAALGGWTLYLCVYSLMAQIMGVVPAPEFVIWWELTFIAIAVVIGVIIAIKSRQKEKEY